MVEKIELAIKLTPELEEIISGFIKESELVEPIVGIYYGLDDAEEREILQFGGWNKKDLENFEKVYINEVGGFTLFAFDPVHFSRIDGHTLDYDPVNKELVIVG